jgi:hypothetical protein
MYPPFTIRALRRRTPMRSDLVEWTLSPAADTTELSRIPESFVNEDDPKDGNLTDLSGLGTVC